MIQARAFLYWPALLCPDPELERRAGGEEDEGEDERLIGVQLGLGKVPGGGQTGMLCARIVKKAANRPLKNMNSEPSQIMTPTASSCGPCTVWCRGPCGRGSAAASLTASFLVQRGRAEAKSMARRTRPVRAPGYCRAVLASDSPFLRACRCSSRRADTRVVHAPGGPLPARIPPPPRRGRHPRRHRPAGARRRDHIAAGTPLRGRRRDPVLRHRRSARRDRRRRRGRAGTWAGDRRAVSERSRPEPAPAARAGGGPRPTCSRRSASSSASWTCR